MILNKKERPETLYSKPKNLILITVLALTQTLALAATTPTTDHLQKEITQSLTQGKSKSQIQNQIYNRYGTQSITALKQILKTQTNSDELRWFALLTIVRLTGKDSLQTIQATLKDPNWILRNAALKAAVAIEATELQDDIESLLHDKSLIIRTTAVDSIGKLQLAESAPKLVNALFDEKNYHKGLKSKALWIYDHILNVLTQFQHKQSVPKLVKLMELRLNAEDTDENSPKLLTTLEKITGKKFKANSLKEQVFLWKRNTLAEQTF